jgi:uncharacterized protein involved in exopolysaccharide biosynthesis
MEWARDLRWEMAQALLRHRQWVIGMLLAGVLLGGFAASQVRPVYRASTTLVVEASGRESAGQIPEEVLRTLEQSACRPEVEAAVWNALDQGGGSARGGGPVPATQSEGGKRGGRPAWSGNARWRRGTALMDLEWEAQQEGVAEIRVGAWARQVVKLQEAEDARRTQGWERGIQAEEQRLRNCVRAAGEALRRFREEQGGVEGARDRIREAVREFRERLAAVEAETLRLETDWSGVGAAHGVESLYAIPSLARMEEVSAAWNRLRAAQSAMVAIDTRYGGRHPRRIQAGNEAGVAFTQLRETLERGVVRLAAERKLRGALRTELEGRIREEEKRLAVLEKVSAEEQSLQRTVSSEQALLEGFLSRSRQWGLVADSAGYRVRILSEPARVGAPQRPGAARRVLAGIVLGMLTAVGGTGVAAVRRVRWPVLEGRPA